MQISIHRTALILADGFGLLDTHGLAFAALFVIPAAMATINSTCIRLIALSVPPVNSSPLVS
ncbi:hypothetical protein JJD84_28920 [Pseudomonas fluorescens]|nr:hypothetical protein [Pseudomonas fluorescens]